MPQICPNPAPAALLLSSRIYCCWLGKSIGGTLGLPAEGKTGRLDFSFYNPVPTQAPPNDDLELQLVWLHLVERSNGALTQADFAKAWLDHIHYMWDEYGRCRWNLRRGVPAESAGTFENHFHACMGSPIRSEIWACLFPGDPDSAAYYAALDASLDHGIEGMAGEVLFAVMQSEIMGGMDLEDAISHALTYIPEESETSQALALVHRNYREGTPAWDCWKELIIRYGNENFTHAPLNVALTIWALLYGGQDFEASILLAVNAGYDTDCTAATAGATLGCLLGKEQIPRRWIEPIGEGIFVGPGVVDIPAPKTLAELTGRTEALIGKLEKKTWYGSIWKTTPPVMDLAAIPGTIWLHPLDGSSAVPWANGELPVEVKAAGGADWTWTKTSGEPREIICLAHEGAVLTVDGDEVHECPAGLPYVPATHRSPEGSRARIDSKAGRHQVRLKLRSRSPSQKASLILAYPNLHICPWTPDELPDAAVLAPA
jgi:ADP-ribosylglycohydrolase